MSPADFVRGSSWLERWITAWVFANFIIEGFRGNWPHAITYVLATTLALSSSAYRQLAEESLDIARRARVREAEALRQLRAAERRIADGAS